MPTEISLARVYEDVTNEGHRLLVDRLWPRGLSRDDWPEDRWRPDLAPTSDLRKWFHEDPGARFDEFSERYRIELDDNPALQPLLDIQGSLTLVTAARDPERSHISVLRDYLIDTKN